MSSDPVRRVSPKDIQLVQNLIKGCLQLYMDQKEVVDILLAQAKIEPGFTELVWKKLEEENREFFKAYYLQLMVKQQIVEFNSLLEQQVKLMHQLQQSGGSAAFPTSNGSHMQQLHQNPAYYGLDHAGPTMKPGNMHQHPVNCNIPNTFTNGGPSLHINMHAAVNISIHTSRLDIPPSSMLSTPNSNMGMIKADAGFSGTTLPFMFGTDNSNVVMDSRQTIGNPAVTSFNGVESNSQPLNDSFLDAESTPYGTLSQIPRNFSLSDLTADFSQSSDILESYARSPFMVTDNNNFLDSRDREYQGNNRRLDSISKGLSFED